VPIAAPGSAWTTPCFPKIAQRLSIASKTGVYEIKGLSFGEGVID